MEKHILNYILDNGENITLTEKERKMLVSLAQTVIKCLDQMKREPAIIDVYIQTCYQLIEKVQNDGKEVITEKESATTNKEA